MTPKEYKNKMMVKVVGSTDIDNLFLRGQILEVISIHYSDQRIQLIYKKYDIEYYVWFNLSDVQIATPVMYEGVNVCLQDKIFVQGFWREVYDYVYSDGRWRLYVGSFDNSYVWDVEYIQALDPLYKEVKEELAVGSEAKLELSGGRIIKVKVIE